MGRESASVEVCQDAVSHGKQIGICPVLFNCPEESLLSVSSRQISSKLLGAAAPNARGVLVPRTHNSSKYLYPSELNWRELFQIATPCERHKDTKRGGGPEQCERSVRSARQGMCDFQAPPRDVAIGSRRRRAKQRKYKLWQR